MKMKTSWQAWIDPETGKTVVEATIPQRLAIHRGGTPPPDVRIKRRHESGERALQMVMQREQDARDALLGGTRLPATL